MDPDAPLTTEAIEDLTQGLGTDVTSSVGMKQKGGLEVVVRLVKMRRRLDETEPGGLK